MLDGKVEKEHMKRHYDAHHADVSKCDKKVVTLDKRAIEDVQLFFEGQPEKHVAWCENWREIAIAIATN